MLALLVSTAVLLYAFLWTIALDMASAWKQIYVTAMWGTPGLTAQMRPVKALIIVQVRNECFLHIRWWEK